MSRVSVYSGHGSSFSGSVEPRRRLPRRGARFRWGELTSIEGTRRKRDRRERGERRHRQRRRERRERDRRDPSAGDRRDGRQLRQRREPDRRERGRQRRERQGRQDGPWNRWDLRQLRELGKGRKGQRRRKTGQSERRHREAAPAHRFRGLEGARARSPDRTPKPERFRNGAVVLQALNRAREITSGWPSASATSRASRARAPAP